MNGLISKFPSSFSVNERRNEIRWMIESILSNRIHKHSSREKIQSVHISSHQLESSFESLTHWERNKLQIWLNQRTQHHKPLQYILKRVDFCELELMTRPPILIPRWETEEWTWELIKDIIKEKHKIIRPLKILDLCTGSGCISLALAHHLHINKIPCHIQGLDISQKAIMLAKLNQRKLGIPVSILEFHQKDILSNLDSFKDVDMIVSNPPYISEKECMNLDPSVSLWEDHQALFASDNGLYFLKRILNYSFHLKNKTAFHLPRLVAEIGDESSHVLDLQKYMDSFGRFKYEIRKDLGQNPRVLIVSHIS